MAQKAKAVRDDPEFSDMLKTLGGVVRQYRTSAPNEEGKPGMTLDALAEKVALTPGYLSKIEAGVAKPTVSALHAIARNVGIEDGIFGLFLRSPVLFRGVTLGTYSILRRDPLIKDDVLEARLLELDGVIGVYRCTRKEPTGSKNHFHVMEAETTHPGKLSDLLLSLIRGRGVVKTESMLRLTPHLPSEPINTAGGASELPFGSPEATSEFCMIGVEHSHDREVGEQVANLHECDEVWSVMGRCDLVAKMRTSEPTLDGAIAKIEAIQGVEPISPKGPKFERYIVDRDCSPMQWAKRAQHCLTRLDAMRRELEADQAARHDIARGRHGGELTRSLQKLAKAAADLSDLVKNQPKDRHE